MMNNETVELAKTIIKQTKESFSTEIEDLVWMKDISYLESLVELSEKYDIDTDKVKKLLTPEIISKIEIEAEKLSLITKTNGKRLDF